MDAGLLVGRLVLGTLMAAHGAQKLFGWFGGYGPAATGAFFEALGFRPGRAFALAAAGSEVASGALVALGLLGPVGPAVMLSVMIVAAVSVHWHNGVFATNKWCRAAVVVRHRRQHARADRAGTLLARRPARSRVAVDARPRRDRAQSRRARRRRESDATVARLEGGHGVMCQQPWVHGVNTYDLSNPPCNHSVGGTTCQFDQSKRC
jgi:putative oxidoreductase